jgi:hypothetical protein
MSKILLKNVAFNRIKRKDTNSLEQKKIINITKNLYKNSYDGTTKSIDQKNVML